MAEPPVRIEVDGRQIEAAAEATLLAVLWNAGLLSPRRSLSGQPRGPLCAMGICFECRVEVDGVSHLRACTQPVRAGMRVRTGG